MDTVEYFTRLYAYDAWANHEALAGLKAAPEPPARALKFIAHILAAERLWLGRLEEEKQAFPVWPALSLGACEAMAADLPRLWKNYLEATTEADLAEPISYRNSQGESWSSRRDDILTHVAMHSAYHRGQIAADMRSAGFTPAYTDFIHSVRRGLIE